MSTPAQLDGLAVRPDKHPSILAQIPMKSLAVTVRLLVVRVDCDSMFYPQSGLSTKPLLEGDRSGEMSHSNYSQDADSDVIGQMDPDSPTPYYDVIPSRQSDSRVTLWWRSWPL